jgi:hypothetical protein
MTTLTASPSFAEAFRIELRRFLDAILKAGRRDDATESYVWGRGL